MKNRDTESISSLYESKIVKSKVLNEAMPPFASDEGLSPEKHKQFKGGAAMHKPAYAQAPYKAYRLSEEEARNAIYHVGKALLDMFKKQPDGIYPGDKTGLYKDMAPMVMNMLKDSSGKPLYNKSFAYHIARNIVDALIETRVIKYWQDPKSKGEKVGTGAKAKDLSQVVAAIPAPEEVVNAKGETPAE